MMLVTFSKHDALAPRSEQHSKQQESVACVPFSPLTALAADVKETEHHVTDLKAGFADTCGFGADTEDVVAARCVVGPE